MNKDYLERRKSNNLAHEYLIDQYRMNKFKYKNTDTIILYGLDEYLKVDNFVTNFKYELYKSGIYSFIIIRTGIETLHALDNMGFEEGGWVDVTFDSDYTVLGKKFRFNIEELPGYDE